MLEVVLRWIMELTFKSAELTLPPVQKTTDRPFPVYKGDDPYILVRTAHVDDTLVYPESQRLKGQGFNVSYVEGIGRGNKS